MRFLESTDLLKIEDILPFFPDFVVIDDFKDEIANALESYSNQIESRTRWMMQRVAQKL
jgi:vacuolar protein sorting-associated protein 18